MLFTVGQASGTPDSHWAEEATRDGRRKVKRVIMLAVDKTSIRTRDVRRAKGVGRRRVTAVEAVGDDRVKCVSGGMLQPSVSRVGKTVAQLEEGK